MSTFLELCQDTARESGTVQGVQPASVLSQTGRLAKIVYWVKRSWRDIQRSRSEWLWMRAEFSVAVTSGTQRYTSASFGLTRLSKWITDQGSTTIYKTSLGSVDETDIFFIDWQDWRRRYGRGVQVANRPVHYSITPANEIVFGPNPDASYTVRGEYMKSPQSLAANADVPEMPAKYHDLIVYKALENLNIHDEAILNIKTSMDKYDELVGNLEREQLETMVIGSRALA